MAARIYARDPCLHACGTPLRSIWADAWQSNPAIGAREFAHVVERVFQPLGIKLHIKCNGMNVCWHDDVGIDPQTFILNTEVEIVCDDLTSSLFKEHR